MARQPLNAFLTQVGPGGTLTVNAGGRLYLYEAGTTDEAEVWDAKVGGSLVDQPLVPDADGSFPGHWIEDDHDYDRTIVGDALNPIQSWKLRKGARYVIYPRDYGAVEDGVTDETDALRDCINDALAHNKETTVAFQPITYIVDGDPDTTQLGNTILPVIAPNTTEAITLEGAGLGYNLPRRTILKTTRTTDAYSEEGPPSVIGGQTTEGQTAAGGSGAILACGPVTLRGISVEVPNNPAIAGIDALSFGGVILDRSGVIAGTGLDATETPENPWAFGIRLPGAYAFGLIDLRGFKSRQMYAGIVLRKTDHIMFGAGAGAVRCVVGLAFEEVAGDGGPPLGGGYVQLDACKYLLAGWNPEDGAKSLGTAFTRRVINGLRVEAEPTQTAPFTEVASVLDANDKLVGRISLHRGANDFFSGMGQGTITGAQNLDIYNPVNPNLATLRTTAPANADVMTSQLVIWLDDTPDDVKVMFKAKDSAGTPVEGELTTGAPPPASETLTTSVGISAATGMQVQMTSDSPLPPGETETRLYNRGNSLVTKDASSYVAQGFDSFVFASGWLEGLGGDGNDRQTIYDGIDAFRADAGPGITTYLGMYVNSTLPITDQWGGIPYDWMNTSFWNSTVVPAFANVRAEAEANGFDGLSLDMELYHPGLQQNRGWKWNYYGATSEAAKRAAVLARATDVGEALAGMDKPCLIYNHAWPECLESLRQTMTDGVTPHPLYNPHEFVWKEFFDGLEAGGLDFMFIDSDCYKDYSAPLSPGPFANWHQAADQQRASLAEHWPGHEHRWSPFIWLTDGPNTIAAKNAGQPYSGIWDRTRDTAYCNTQISECRAESPNNTLTVYDYGGTDVASNYAPFNL